MPAAAAAALASAVFTAAGGVAAGTLAVAAATLAYGAAFAVVSLGISFAIGSLMGAVFKRGSQNGFSAEAQGRTQVVRSNVQPRNIIYGRSMASGPLVFAASSDEGSVKNRYMHLVVVLADHECDAIEEVYLGEDPVGALDANGYPIGGKFLKTWGDSSTYQNSFTGPEQTFYIGPGITRITSVVITTADGGTAQADYTWIPGWEAVVVRGTGATVTITYEKGQSHPRVLVRKHLGAPDQIADGWLVAENLGWTWEHRLQGVCYVYVRLDWDTDMFPNGLPNIKAVVRGKKVLDPRSGNTYWTSNWALCVYDFLRDERGFGCTDVDIDVATVIASANISDEQVPLYGGGSQARYLCDGNVMTDKSPRDSLAEMVTAGGGVVTITGGVFRVFAGAYDIPTVTLTEDDLRGPVKVRPRTSRKDLFNRVKGTYVDPYKSWQPGDFPAQSNPTYAAQDGGVIDRDIELPFTLDPVMAQRLARIILERSRQSIVVEYPAKLTAFQLTAYSTVKLTLAKFGWSNKVFRVMDWKMSDDGGIDLVLNEEAAAVYDWSLGWQTVLDPAPDTNLPNPFDVEAVGQLALQSGADQLIVSQSGVVTSRIQVTWPAAADASLAQGGRVEIEYKRAADVAWTALSPIRADTTVVYVSPVEDGQPYQVRARFLSALGVRSRDWTYSPVHTVVGKLAPPSNMTGLSLSVLNGMANLTWDVATDVDVKNGGQVRIRHTTDLVQPSWGSAIDIGGYISGAANSAQLPLLEGVYLGKWIDSTGNESPAAVMVITTAPSLIDLNIVATVQEHPSFTGAKTNMVLDRDLGGIKLIGTGLIDAQGPIDATGLWDDQAAVDTLGPIDTVVGSGGWGYIDSLGGIVDTGSYAFASTFDLGSVEKCRLTAKVDSVSFDVGDAIDERLDLIDTWQSIDGDVINDTSVSLFIRTTSDNPSGAPTWSGWQRFAMGDYEMRAAQWKVEAASASSTHNMVIKGLTVGIDMPDRREAGRDVLSGAGAKAITYVKPFRIQPNLGITAKNMAQGDYFVITAESASGFTITFFNSAGSPVSRKFDWDAVGY